MVYVHSVREALGNYKKTCLYSSKVVVVVDDVCISICV